MLLLDSKQTVRDSSSGLINSNLLLILEQGIKFNNSDFVFNSRWPLVINLPFLMRVIPNFQTAPNSKYYFKLNKGKKLSLVIFLGFQHDYFPCTVFVKIIIMKNKTAEWAKTVLAEESSIDILDINWSLSHLLNMSWIMIVLLIKAHSVNLVKRIYICNSNRRANLFRNEIKTKFDLTCKQFHWSLNEVCYNFQTLN